MDIWRGELRTDPGIFLGAKPSSSLESWGPVWLRAKWGIEGAKRPWIEGEDRVESAKRPRTEGEARVEGAKRLRIEGEVRTEGEAREKTGEGYGEGARWAPPQKFF